MYLSFLANSTVSLLQRKMKLKPGNNHFSQQLKLHTSTARRCVKLIRETVQKLKTLIKLYGPYVPPPGKALKASHEIPNPSEICKTGYCDTSFQKQHTVKLFSLQTWIHCHLCCLYYHRCWQTVVNLRKDPSESADSRKPLPGLDGKGTIESNPVQQRNFRKLDFLQNRSDF